MKRFSTDTSILRITDGIDRKELSFVVSNVHRIVDTGNNDISRRFTNCRGRNEWLHMISRVQVQTHQRVSGTGTKKYDSTHRISQRDSLPDLVMCRYQLADTATMTTITPSMII